MFEAFFGVPGVFRPVFRGVAFFLVLFPAMITETSVIVERIGHFERYQSGGIFAFLMFVVRWPSSRARPSFLYNSSGRLQEIIS